MDTFQKTGLLSIVAIFSIVLFISGKVTVAEVTSEDINILKEKAEKEKSKILQPEMDPQMMERARRLTDEFFSEEYQKRIQQEIERLKSHGTFKPYVESYEKQRKKKEESYPPRLAGSERLYLFISFSMPEDVIRTYVEEAEQYGVKLVLRGVPGGFSNLKDGIVKVQRLLLKDPACSHQDCPSYKTEILIDPFLFKRYRITRVPALVYVRGVEFNDPELSEGYDSNIKSHGDYFTVYGDVSFEGAIKKLVQLSGSESLRRLLYRK
jgi:conjugal transfer pilus assembly protein TrbC